MLHELDHAGDGRAGDIERLFNVLLKHVPILVVLEVAQDAAVHDGQLVQAAGAGFLPDASAERVVQDLDLTPQETLQRLVTGHGDPSFCCLVPNCLLLNCSVTYILAGCPEKSTVRL